MSKTFKKNQDDWESRRRQQEKRKERNASKKKFLYEKPVRKPESEEGDDGYRKRY